MREIRVCFSPSNQIYNQYAGQNTSEGEQCQLQAEAAVAALARCSTSDLRFNCLIVDNTMLKADKVAASNAFGAHLHVPNHTNASVNHNAVGTRLYCSAEGGKGHLACKAIYKYLAPLTPSGGDVIKTGANLYEITYANAPTAYIETDFHDVPEVAGWLVSHATEVGEAIAHGICDYFGVEYREPIAEQAPPVEAPDEDETGDGATDMEKEVATLRDEVAALRAQLKVYHTLLDVPDWAKPEIRKLIEAGVLFGTSADGSLDLTHDLTRALVILARILFGGDKEAG